MPNHVNAPALKPAGDFRPRWHVEINMVVSEMDGMKSKNSIIQKIGLANTIASVTFLLTLVTFYYQYWRVDYALNATVLTLAPNYNGAALAIDAVFTNNGNRQCSIAKINVIGKGTYKEELFNSNSSFLECSQAPFSVSPNEVISKQLLFGEGQVIPTHKDPRCLQDPNCAKPIKSEYRLALVVIDVKGKCHEIITDVIISNDKNIDEFNIHTKLPKIIKLMPSPVKEGLQTTGFPQLRSKQSNK